MLTTIHQYHLPELHFTLFAILVSSLKNLHQITISVEFPNFYLKLFYWVQQISPNNSIGKAASAEILHAFEQINSDFKAIQYSGILMVKVWLNSECLVF